MSSTHFAPEAFSVYFAAGLIGYEERGVKAANGKIQRNIKGQTIWIADAYRVTISLGISRTRGRSGCLTAR